MLKKIIQKKINPYIPIYYILVQEAYNSLDYVLVDTQCQMDF